jgi:prolyl-tRNA synthetase
MGAKSLCIPFDQSIGGAEITAETKCINPKCTRSAQKWCMFGRMSPYPILSTEEQSLTPKRRLLLNVAGYMRIIY